MTRREWLTRVIGAVAAAAAAPLIDLTDTTPAFWNQPTLKKFLQWQIAFPDGTTYSFDATVIAEKLLGDGTVQLTMQPTGPMEIGSNDVPMGDKEPLRAGGTLVYNEGIPIAELQEISMPTFYDNVDVTMRDDPFEQSIRGLKHTSLTLTYTPRENL